MSKVYINGRAYPLLKINGVEVPKITKYQTLAPKLWSADTGRDLAGTNKGTLVGIFTKIQVETAFLTQSQYQALSTQLDKASITVQYYDNSTKHIYEEQMYANDRQENLLSSKRLDEDSFSFNLIANKKKSYRRLVV